MAEPLTTDNVQYLYCAACLEMQDLKTPELAITIVNGHAVCEEHRRRATNMSIGSLVSASRKFHTDGPRNGGYRGGSRESTYR